MRNVFEAYWNAGMMKTFTPQKPRNSAPQTHPPVARKRSTF